MLETIREYAGERLRERRRQTRLAQRHLRVLPRARGDRRARRSGHSAQTRGFRGSTPRTANIRAALGWATENEEAEIAVRLSAALYSILGDPCTARRSACLARPGAGAAGVGHTEPSCKGTGRERARDRLAVRLRPRRPGCSTKPSSSRGSSATSRASVGASASSVMRACTQETLRRRGRGARRGGRARSQ